MKGRFAEELRRAARGLLELFFTRECVVCGAVLNEDESFLCAHCLGDIPLTYFWTYSENAAMERLGGLCMRGGGADGGSDDGGGCRVYNVAALFFYRHNSPYCDIVRQFKYGRRENLGLWAAHLLGDYLARGGLFGDVQAVVPVPLHPRKRWKRGFNQAEIIARGVAERLGCDTGAAEAGTRPGLPVTARLLRRRRYTSTQTRKSAGERAGNVSGAFAVNLREAERLRAAGIQHILIVDDVLTTGATLAECIRLLEGHFTVSAATLGFVE